MVGLNALFESTFFWVMAFFAACLVVVLMMPKQVPNLTAVRIKSQRWIGKHYFWLFIIVGGCGITWAFLAYIHQLPGLIAQTLNGLKTVIQGDPNADGTSTNVRNYAYAFGALAAALTIMATIPFQLIKVWMNERSARTAEQSHITDQINKAVEGLGVEKTVFEPDEDGKSVQRTHPNIEVRVGAIYALERISQDSLRDHVQIMEILTAYVRENSAARTAKPFTDPESGEEIPDWKPLSKDASDEARALHLNAEEKRFGIIHIMSKASKWALNLTARADIQAAVQVLGRRTEDQCTMETTDVRFGPEGYRMDLRDTNLQAVDISHLNFRNALLQNARLEGAKLSNTHMEGANLFNACLNGAILSYAHLAEATLSKTRMEGASLFSVSMEGANLRAARLEATNLNSARMEGADLDSIHLSQFMDLRVETNHASALRSVDFTDIVVSEDFLKSAFGDGSVTLPEGYTAGEGVLVHWHPEVLDRTQFRKAWHEWQDEIGYRRRD